MFLLAIALAIVLLIIGHENTNSSILFINIVNLEPVLNCMRVGSSFLS